METLGFTAVCLAALVGAVGQRALGMGFGLIAMPVLVLVLGPLPAVVAVNALGIVTSGITTLQVWRAVEWRRLLWLLLPALVAVPFGVVLARAADDAVLKVIVGAMILAGVAVTVGVRRSERSVRGTAPVVATGAIVGLLNSSVGVGAPALGIYGAVGDWPQRSYAAALQPFFLVLSLVTVSAKAVLNPAGAPPWPWWMWAIAVVPLVIGVTIGGRVAAWLPERTARGVILLISLAGGVFVLWSGIAALPQR